MSTLQDLEMYKSVKNYPNSLLNAEDNWPKSGTLYLGPLKH